VPLELPQARPDQTALLLIDLQYGLFEPHSSEPEARQMLARAAEVSHGARAHGVRVVHCTKFDRPGFLGWSTNTPSWRRRARSGARPMLQGSRPATVLAELGPREGDLIVPRSRGASPFTGTELDPVLRNLGCRVIVLAGLSLNVALISSCVEGVSLGYEVVVLEDAVLGFPSEYGAAMLQHSFRVMSTVIKSRDLMSVWTQRWAPLPRPPSGVDPDR